MEVTVKEWYVPHTHNSAHQSSGDLAANTSYIILESGFVSPVSGM